MGNNFHTAPSALAYTAAAWATPFSTLDRAITYLKNVMVGGGGVITHNKATGVLSWSATIRIKFYTAAGAWVENTIAAGNVTLADGQAAYVTLNETDATVLTVSAGSSGFLAYNVLVLAYRETTSDNIYSVYFHPQLNDPDKIVQVLTDADTVTIDWSRGSTAKITLDRAATTITSSGGYDGQNCKLIVKQYAGTGAITLDASHRPGTDTSLTPTLTATDGKEDYLGFTYRGGAIAKYDFVAFAQGF